MTGVEGQDDGRGPLPNAPAAGEDQGRVHYVRIKDGKVVDRSVANGALPPGWFAEGETWIASEDGQIGDDYDGKAFTRPLRAPEPEPEPPPPDPRDAKIAALEAELAAMKTRLDRLDPAGAGPDGAEASVKTR